jgi:cytidine deaminase
MVINGINSPCGTCRGVMNSAAEQSGGQTIYRRIDWPRMQSIEWSTKV